MRITKGRVVNGNIIVEGESLNEGSIVTVLVSDEQNFTLSDVEEAALLESIAQANRRELLDGEDVAQLQKAGKWWPANREKAPEAFREELRRGGRWSTPCRWFDLQLEFNPDLR